VVDLQIAGVTEGSGGGLLSTSEGGMEYYAGIDVSLDTVSVCIVAATGKVLREAKVAGSQMLWYHGSVR
jgi:hypothetical protein